MHNPRRDNWKTGATLIGSVVAVGVFESVMDYLDRP